MSQIARTASRTAEQGGPGRCRARERAGRRPGRVPGAGAFQGDRMSSLMISVAGVRGIVGDSLTPAVVARFAAAFARSLGDGPIVVGRDARISGPVVYQAVATGL